MKKILASMIIIIELLCFCNTTIAMAMNDTDSVEVQQEVAENSTKVESIKESTEEKKQEENKTMEIPKSENTEENVTSQEIAVPEKKDVEEDKLIEVEETSKEIMSETEVVQEELEKEKLEENIIDDEAIINSEDTPEIPDKVVRVTFTYNNISYSVDLSSKELGVDLNGYEYYFVTKTNTGLNLYYSNERIRASYKYPSEDKYDIRCCKNTISVKINTTTGELEKSILNLQESYSVIYKKNIVVSNQNIYHTTSNTKIFDKNCGYEYDVSKEKGENCNEVVKATKTINIYEKAGINHDIIATIQEGLTIKRIKKSVNEMHGHVWDKIELSDGQEAYVFSDEVELITDTKEINFKYNDKKYTIYLSSSSLNMNLDEYEYYFVTKTNTGLNLYYSNERIKASYKYPSDEKYDINGGINTIILKINNNGTLEKSIFDLKNKYKVIIGNNIVVSNQNIYHNNDILFKKNYGYEYDDTKEKGEICNDVVKAIKTITVYEKAGVNYDIIATVQEGLTIKRIKKAVNEIHGHVWDKIELSDGQEAYVFSDEIEPISDAKEISFKYEDKVYKTYLSPSSLNINLDNYEYYFVTKTNTGLNLYYSNERIRASYKYPSEEKYDINGGINTIIITINSNGTLSKSTFDFKNKYKVILRNNIVASNQNIYHTTSNTKIFDKSCGYEYDTAKEKEENCNETVKTIKTINIYEKAGINHDIIATVQEGIAIKRIKKSVNEIHGHVWDKIELSDGQEAYVFSDEVELITDTKEINFKYNDKKYTIYLSSSSLNMNLDNYEYYFVTKTNTGLNLYYSNERIRASYKYPSEEKYDINGGINTIIITINSNGTLSKSTFDFKNKYKVILRNNIVASNQNIYHTTSNTKIFDKSCGYEYDTAKEKEENCNETVKTIKTINIYEKAGINHDIIATVQEGIAIKRIKKSVNEIHGHVWDKIELSDGQEAYVFSDEVELITDTKEINFKYNDKKYTIYLSSSSLNMNLDNYEYYFVTKTNTGLNLYYSNERIRASYKYPSEEKYDINGGINTIIITINSNGTLSKSTFDFKNKYKVILRNNIVASNQKIYYNNSVINNVSIYDQVEKIYYQENYLWNQISQSYNTSKEIDNKERLYDSMTRLEKVEMLDDLTVWWNTAWASAMYFKDALPHASSALLYFLTKGESGKTSNTYQYENELFREGHTMRELQIDKYCVKDQLNKTINSVLTAAESINGVKDEDYITFCNVEEASGEVLPGTALDWYLTVHNYRIKTENCFFRINDFYKLNLKFGLIDYYDWEKGDPEYSDSVEEMAKEALGIVASQMFELHRAGMARNYTNYAEVNYIIRWNKGQRMGAEGMSPSVVYIGGESVDE